jgi:hypothetical protein
VGARDLGSTTGSRVNGERITEPCILHSGDLITAGRVTLVYRDCEKFPAGAVVFTDDASATAATAAMSESLEGLMAGSASGSRHMQALITAGRELATHLPLDKLFDLILHLSMDAAGE